MKDLRYDAVIIGGGAAGMAAALELNEKGFTCAIVEREDHLGGILMQCIHNGFGLHEFSEELSGPEFAERFIARTINSNIAVYLNTTVTRFNTGNSGSQVKELFCVSPDGVMHIQCRVIILAMGCREKNRGNIRIPGSRPAGVFTAGLAQHLVNIEGYILGKEVVIIGSGDIGLIMARRMTWVGCKVKAVVEIMPYPSGLTRNIVQCLKDNNIPLYLSSQTSLIMGNDRVEGVEITPLENGSPIAEKSFRIACDTVLLSVGLVPENELSRAAGVEINANTGGPLVDSMLMTNVDGIFACGNVLHVHDLVDWVSEESRRAGQYAAQYLAGESVNLQITSKAGANVRYVNPGKIDPDRDNKIYLRSMAVKHNATVEIKLDKQVIRSIKKPHVQPPEMISLDIGPRDFDGLQFGVNSILEIGIV